jgi:hypothetical protein
MTEHRVLILGNSLLAESMAHLLRANHQVCVAERVSTMDEARVVLADQVVDALIMIGTTDETSAWYLSVLDHHPTLPVVRNDLSRTTIHVITSHCVEARLDQLLAAIAALPQRGSATPDLEPAMRG